MLKKLIRIAPPPKSPVQVDGKKWDEAAERLGFELPDDYRQYCAAYGTGAFEETGGWLINPFNVLGDGVDKMLTLAGVYAEYRDDEGEECVPYSVHPESPGLLPWGIDNSGTNLVWLTEGPPGRWPVLINQPGYPRFQRFDVTMTEFLLSTFTKKIVWDVRSQPDPSFGPGRSIVFRPGLAML